MRKLSEIPFDESMDVLANILSPVAGIATADDIRNGGAKNKLQLLQIMLRGHKDECCEILSAICGVTPEEYRAKGNLLSLSADLMTLLGDETFMSFFISAGQKKG